MDVRRPEAELTSPEADQAEAPQMIQLCTPATDGRLTAGAAQIEPSACGIGFGTGCSA